MHQHPRPSPATASPAVSPRTNPTRTNNSRDQDRAGSRTSSDRGTPSDQGIGLGEGTDAILRLQETSAQGKDAIGRLNQIVQNYFTKAALVILNARVALPPAFTRDTKTRRINKWFNVEIDETDVTRDELRVWRSCEALSNRPPPMIIETFIDTDDLTNNQSLVVVDEQGKRWDVEETLNVSHGSSARDNIQLSRPEVILERWVVQLGEPPKEMPTDLAPILPRTYKNSIVLYRSLYACVRLLPAWKLSKKIFNSRLSHSSPKIRYRILQEPRFDRSLRSDRLSIPLYESHEEVLETFTFDPIESPAGPISIHATFRSNCEFRIDDSEALLSSRFMGMDEQYFEPSLGRRTLPNETYRAPAAEVGSLPHKRQERLVRPDQGQAYGSMSTFHQAGLPIGTSPISALRAARSTESESPEDVMPRKIPPNTRSAQGSRSSVRSADGAPSAGRRPSVSFMPFKTPSLSASPSQAEQMTTSIPRGSIGKSSPLAALAEARNPAMLGPHGSIHSRGSPGANEPALPSSISSSPKPGPPTRYSSSFGHRRAKLSTGGSSRTEDDNSSGKGSVTSSTAQPGSGVLAEGGASSGSIQTDDDNISDFLKMLDQKKDLKSFRKPNDQAASEASTRRTSAALNKFQRMKDSNAALGDSMSSSIMLHRSSTSSSRQLSSVPAMVAGTSISTSSSPGKPISPHTPHTPAIPSRLSANSIIEYPHRPQSDDSSRRTRPVTVDGAQESGSGRESNPGAIDIPTSPRPFHPSYRRSSSAAQGPRVMQIEDDDIFPFAMRSASLGMDDDRPPPSLSVLAGLQGGTLQDDSNVAIPSVEQRDTAFGPLFNTGERSPSAPCRQGPSGGSEEAGSLLARGGPYRPRIGRGGGRGDTPPQGSSSSLLDRGSGSGSSDHRGGRYSLSRPPSNFEEEEPLLFSMSDFGVVQQSRRSMEEARGSSAAERGGSESGASSRRGSRRGGY